MSSDTKKTVLTENTSNKPRLISDGILMYPERLNLREAEVEMVGKGGYMIVLGGKQFVVKIKRHIEHLSTIDESMIL